MTDLPGPLAKAGEQLMDRLQQLETEVASRKKTTEEMRVGRI